MKNSRNLIISTASNRLSKQWKKENITWTSFVERLSKPIITTESIDEFLTFPKSKQDDIKDVGGFVGGSLKGNLRRNSAVENRSLITLDLDNLAHGDDEKILKTLHGLGCGFAVYSTRKHTKVKPRLRVILPLARSVSADEYEPIARKIASFIGMRYCDPTTFQAVRLMYWPSHSKDSDYVFEYADKPLVDGKGILGMYADWKDVRQWPEVPEAKKLYQNMRKKQENPLEKNGIVGAFCRRYNILEAIEGFIPGVYEACDVEGRLTYIEGSTTAGAVLYEDGLFLYSHHATDPCSQKLVNAFDLIRLHKFGHLDSSAEDNTPVNRLPSWTEMVTFINTKTPVKQDILRERREQASNEFGVVPYKEVAVEGEVIDADTEDWMGKLDCNNHGYPYPTIPNIVCILKNDVDIKDKIYYEEFSNRIIINDHLPWAPDKYEERIWSDIDDSGLRWFFENFYKITGVKKIEDGLNLITKENSKNAIEEYLIKLEWDGVNRLETLLIDYFGCADNVYTREVSIKTFVAAVRRAVIGNIKWDHMPILIGSQGIGKSTFLKMLGGKWFNDSLATFEGKEACELIQGSWIVEIGELTGLRKSEVNAAKQFLSRQDDIFREAYGRRTQKYPRRCIFFGTANDSDFLRDSSGERRYWPIDTGEINPKKSIFNDLENEVDLIWAEAYSLAKNSEVSLVLSKEAENIASVAQETHKEENAKKGIIVDYLEKKIPKSWTTMDLFARRTFLNDYEKQVELHKDLEERDKICVLEIWEEALGCDKRYLKRVDSREISEIMNGLKGWEKIKSTARFGKYGIQKGYKKV